MGIGIPKTTGGVKSPAAFDTQAGKIGVRPLLALTVVGLMVSGIGLAKCDGCKGIKAAFLGALESGDGPAEAKAKVPPKATLIPETLVLGRFEVPRGGLVDITLPTRVGNTSMNLTTSDILDRWGGLFGPKNEGTRKRPRYSSSTITVRAKCDTKVGDAMTLVFSTRVPLGQAKKALPRALPSRLRALFKVEKNKNRKACRRGWKKPKPKRKRKPIKKAPGALPAGRG